MPVNVPGVPSSAARIALCDVPFVRLRGLSEKAFREAPGSYMRLVAGMQRGSPRPVNAKPVRLDLQQGTVRIAGAALELPSSEFALLAAWLDLCRDPHEPP